jgi:CPA2 family monovalent cation:H+ antiporter-2
LHANLELIFTLAASFIGALAFGYAAFRLGWSPIVGYLLAGVLAGPYTPGLVANKEMADQLAEVGVILLMFGVGLHFHLKDLMVVKGIAISGALVQSAVATALGAAAIHVFGGTWASGLVYGLSLSVASTVVLIRVLSDNKELTSPTGRIAVGWLVMEDIFTVFVLVILPVFFTGSSAQQGPSSILLAFGLAALKLAIFIGFTLIAGGKMIPKILQAVAKTNSRELFTLSMLAIALGIAVGAAYLFNVSMALGAFLAGMVVGQSDFSARAGAEALPLRDAFAVMFFLSVGMMFDPVAAINKPLPILATLAVILIGKPVAAMAITLALGYGARVGFGVATALAQIGEFSFLLAALGLQVGALPEEAMNPLVASAILSIMINPWLYRKSREISATLGRKPSWARWFRSNPGNAARPEPVRHVDAAYHAVVVGYGPIGRTVTRLLRERGIRPSIVEMNIETFNMLRSQGEHAVYGDANQREVLESAGVADAAALILSSSGSGDALEAIRNAREINPNIHVVVRADYLRQSDYLRKAGANEVFSGEGEVVLAMTDSILRQLGTTPEQMDLERQRIRKELSLDGSHARA